MCNRAEVLNQFFARHAKAGVRDGDRASLVIRGHADGRGRFGLEDGTAGGLLEPQLLAGVRCVGNQLAHEDFFVRVKGVDNDVQQLLNLGLEMMCFCFAHNN